MGETSAVFTSDNFWPAFMNDLRRAQARVIIQSPFMTLKRLSILYPTIAELVDRAVCVCVFTQTPSRINPAIKPTPQELDRIRGFQDCCKALSSIMVHVNDRSDIHEKLAIVDDSILWEGSLNILSHSKTRERMRRLVSSAEVAAAVTTHSLHDCRICGLTMAGFGGNPVAQMVRIRRSQGITQEELAKRCGLHASAISRVESAGANPRLSSLSRMVDKLEHEIVMVPKWMVAPLLNMIEKNSTGVE